MMILKTNIPRTAQSILIVCLLLSFIDPAAAQQTGKVQITSLNVNDEIVPFIDVIIEGNGIRRELESSGGGDEYENGGLVELPVGIYRVGTRNGNYFDFRRSPFRVRPGAVTMINVYPVRSVRMQMLMSDGSDRYVLAPAPSYDSYNVPHPPGGVTKILIRYDKKRRSSGYVNYEGSALPPRGSARAVERGVMVSYDALAIYAGRVRFDRKKFTITAQGNVIVEDGSQRIKANNVTVRFKNGAPEITTN